MSSPHQILPLPVAGRLSGPQGTLLFSADDLRQHARETESPCAVRASAQEPVLEGINEGVRGLRLGLSAGRKSIGRSPHNDLVIDDPSVSAFHAWIINHRGRCAILNTLSTNGTFVNDKRIHETTLKRDDKVRFGQAEFVFLTSEPGETPSTRGRWLFAGTAALAGLVVLAGAAWWLL